MTLQGFITHRITKDTLWSFVFIFFFYGVTHNPMTRPMPQPLPGNWSIQYMQHPLLFGLAGHNYLSLRDQDGNVLYELHGLATDATTGDWKYVGTRGTDLLHVWEFEKGRYYLSERRFPGRIVQQGNKDAMLALWKRAEECKDKINDQSLPYPPFGINIKNETVNSNSVAYTLALCVGTNIQHLGLMTPGEGKNLLVHAQ